MDASTTTASGSNPDRLVIDLDPGTPAGLRECAQVALLVRDRLGALGLEMFPVTSGSKGMQLYAGLGGRPHVATRSATSPCSSPRS